MQPAATASPRTSLTCCILLTALAVLRLWPLASCGGACTVDFEALKGAQAFSVHLDSADTHLNTWILAWVQHALLTGPSDLFNANIFHPAPGALTASEHMLGVALPLLPLAGLDAAALYQVALIASFALTAITTFALVRWLTGSAWMSFLCGATAIAMPWRITELSHLQLLSSGWVPLIWLLTGRLLLEPGSATRSVSLFVALSLQLLSSYYIAYFTALTLPLLIAALWIAARPSRRNVAVTLLPFAAALVLLAAVSVPYLTGGIGTELTPKGKSLESVALSVALGHLAPRHLFAWPTSMPLHAGYALPSAILLLAVVGIVFTIAGGGRRTRTVGRAPASSGAIPAPDAANARAMAAGLLLIIIAAFVMSLGRHLAVAGTRVPLPAAWAAALVPGFENLRAPLRWGIIISIAAPPLAGIGLWHLRSLLTRVGAQAENKTARMPAVVLVSGLVLATCLWTPLPTTGHGLPDERDINAHEALKAMPEGPVAKVPWPLQADYDATLAARYMVAATSHWRPLLNGYSAYVPSSYDFLRRIAFGLPGPGAVAHLRRLTGVEYFVVHKRDMLPAELVSWDRAVFAGTVVTVYEDGDTRIYAPADGSGDGEWTDMLLSARPRPTTFAGLQRTALALPEGSGQLRVSAPRVIDLFDGGWMKTAVRLTIENFSAKTWPGLDIQTDGLVEARYTLESRNGETALRATAPLYTDVAASSTTQATIIVEGHISAGDYSLIVDLVQRLAGAQQPVPVKPAIGAVRIAPRTERR